MEQSTRRGGVRRAIVWLTAWTLLALAFSLDNAVQRALDGQPVGWGRILRLEFLTFLPWFLLSPALAAVSRRFPIAGPGRLRRLLVHAGASVGFGLVHTAIGVSVGRLVIDDPRPWAALFALSLSRAFIGHLLMYASAIAVLHAVDYYRAFRERELRASRLEAQLAQAQLAVLRTQLQPHFLFNTLHTVSALMARDVPAARRVLSRLSDLLRQSLDADAAPEVPLREELEFLERYLDIQRTRFEDRLAVDFRVEPEALEGAVPRLLLQPLVENSLRHGLSPRAAGGRVEVRAGLRGGRLHLAIADDGVGLPAGLSAPAREGVGLRHTRARLRALCGEAHAFEFRPREGGGVEVRISLPFRPPAPPPAA
ncbi:MAG TPA: histidine kinase [Polyangiaceae bacterium]|nr:histidine kinase [Polyangiaceae bacterium]